MKRIQTSVITLHHRHPAELCNKRLRKAAILPSHFGLALLPTTLMFTHTWYRKRKETWEVCFQPNHCEILAEEDRASEARCMNCLLLHPGLCSAPPSALQPVSYLYLTSPKGKLFSKVQCQNGKWCTARTSDHSGVMAATGVLPRKTLLCYWVYSKSINDQVGLFFLLGPPQENKWKQEMKATVTKPGSLACFDEGRESMGCTQGWGLPMQSGASTAQRPGSHHDTLDQNVPPS